MTEEVVQCKNFHIKRSLFMFYSILCTICMSIDEIVIINKIQYILFVTNLTLLEGSGDDFISIGSDSLLLHLS